MGKVIIEKAVIRKKGCLYYIDKEGNIWETEMKRGGTKKKKEEEIEI